MYRTLQLVATFLLIWSITSIFALRREFNSPLPVNLTAMQPLVRCPPGFNFHGRITQWQPDNIGFSPFNMPHSWIFVKDSALDCRFLAMSCSYRLVEFELFNCCPGNDVKLNITIHKSAKVHWKVRNLWYQEQDYRNLTIFGRNRNKYRENRGLLQVLLAGDGYESCALINRFVVSKNWRIPNVVLATIALLLMISCLFLEIIISDWILLE